MSLFTSIQPGQNLPLYDTRQTFETSESEPLPSDGSTSESENIDVKKCIDPKINNEENSKENNLKNVKSFEECKECNGKVMNDALSQENIQLLRDIKSREKKLKDTRRQLNEERAFYEQQKMDLCKSITKKKSKSQVIQTDESLQEINTVVQDMESQIVNLKKELEKQANKSSKLKEKCQNLRKRNGQLKSEISLNEEDYEKSWKEVRDKLEMYKTEYGNAEKNSGIIKNVYDQVLKKNAYLARSNFALQAELRRLYRKFEKIDKPPSLKRFSSKSTIPSASSPDLWWCHQEELSPKKKKVRRSKTAPGRSNANESSENLVVSGSLISVHIEGDEKRLRPVFLVLDDKRKKGYKKTFFGLTRDGNISDSSAIKQKVSEHELTQRPKSATNELTQIQKNIVKKSDQKTKNSENDSFKKDNSQKIKNESITKKDKKETSTENTKNKINFNHKKKGKTKPTTSEPTTQKDEDETNDPIDKNDSTGNKSPRKCSNELKINAEVKETHKNDETKENDNLDIKQKNDLLESPRNQEISEVETVQKIMNKVTENSRCSNDENCIIECRTHSSSVQ